MNSHSWKSKTNLIGLLVFGILVTAFLLTFMGPTELPEGFVSGNGRTEAIEVDITTKFGGRLEQVFVKEGDLVEPDQTLARVDTRELEAQLRRAQAEVRRTEQEKYFAVAVIAQRKSELSLMRKDMERAKGLYENDGISLEQLQRNETAVETAKATLAAAQAQLSNAEAAIEAAIANTELIKTQIDDSVLRAPIGGRVLYRLAEPGEVLPGGGKVLTVLDPNDIYMTLFLPTHEAARVGIGAEARVVLDGIPDMVIPAHVSYVAPRAQFTPKEVETRTEREKLMFRLKVQLDADFLKAHAALAKTGIPGVAYIRLAQDAEWPEYLLIEEDEE
ncbi:MAG: HlyD family efflux transporter periplasmic adaptor subunit [Gammaproteobacteria bacterium]|nr:HlyD family efflux transporter periplasmic adaptor subunit [Gammaproteobacteria bacterium]